jgi:caa(3)-type oxidase subunit IV
MSEKDETKDSEKPSSESEAKPTAAEKAAAAAVTDESEERDDDDDADEEDSDPNAREAKHGPGSADHGMPAKSDGHGHAHGGHDDHGLAHTTPVSLLVGVLAALMFLTILTVAVTKIDLGSQGNLIVAMVIATIKAGLVVTFFMHLLWDKKFHLILFLTSVLFLILFMSLSINDRSEYEADIETYRAAQAQPK